MTMAWSGRWEPPRPVDTERLRALLVQAAVAVWALPLWFLFLAPTSLGGPVGLIWVSGTSMEPTLSTGDLSIVYRQDRYRVGDVVAFDLPEGGTVIHRVVAVGPDGHTFRGDNRRVDDPWVLDADAIRGRQLVAIPGAASAMTSLGRPEVLAALVAALVVLGRIRQDLDRNDPPRPDLAESGSGS